MRDSVDGSTTHGGTHRSTPKKEEPALQTNPNELGFQRYLLMVRGSLRLVQGQTELAAADFREAIALAQQMGPKTYELRATMSLAHFLAQQGQHDDARTMLAEIYNWFTEGFDTVDLKEAKACCRSGIRVGARLGIGVAPPSL